MCVFELQGNIALVFRVNQGREARVYFLKKTAPFACSEIKFVKPSTATLNPNTHISVGSRKYLVVH